ncbi:hypothetical protein ABFX02_12G068900 [Erythranthe guttata]
MYQWLSCIYQAKPLLHILIEKRKKKMVLSGKLVSQIDIKSDGDVFHEIFRERPHHISDMSPAHIQNCDLHDGEWGTVGSIIYFNYTHGFTRRSN